MCLFSSPSKPDPVPEPIRYQQSKEPVRREGGKTSTMGRKGTLLTKGASATSGGQASSVVSDLSSATGKKTALGA